MANIDQVATMCLDLILSEDRFLYLKRTREIKIVIIYSKVLSGEPILKKKKKKEKGKRFR